MRISLGAMLMALLLTAAMAFAQDYDSQPSQQAAPDNTVAPAEDQQPESAVPAEPTQVAPAPSSEGTTVEGQGVTVEGSSQTSSEVTGGVEGVPAVHYEISEVGEQKGGSLLPNEPTNKVTGTLSSWDTSPTGVYKSSKDHLGSPFPMAAAPAINTGDRSLLPNEIEMPHSMSGNISSWDTAPTAAYKDYELMVGSPFPMSADPSIRMGKNKMSDVDVGADHSRNSPFPDAESLFPTAAAPPRRQWW